MTSGKQGGLWSVGDVSCESVLIVFVALFVAAGRCERQAAACLPLLCISHRKQCVFTFVTLNCLSVKFWAFFAYC